MKTKYQLQIIDRLRKIREERNLSQAFVAKHLGISPGQLGNIESYKRSHKYTLKQIYQLSKLLDVSIEDLFAESHNEQCQNIELLITKIIKYQDDQEKN